MTGQRRPLVYFLLVTAIIMVAVLAYRSFPSQSPVDRTLGDLQHAVADTAVARLKTVPAEWYAVAQAFFD